MVTIDDSDYLAYRLAPGEGRDEGLRLGPGLMPDGSLALDEADGGDLIALEVKHMFRHVGLFTSDLDPIKAAEQVVNPRMWSSWPGVQLVVTDARLAFRASSPEKDGRYVPVGHIRYPWIRNVEFAPKRGIFGSSELLVQVQEDIAGDTDASGFFLHTFTFGFDKSFHAGETTREIACRAARYVAGTQPVQAQAALAELARTGPLADPPKGEHAGYLMPVSVSFPHGHYGLGDGGDGGTWACAEAGS